MSGAAELFLKPIRDLSRNWDIDIASCLEDYLDDLSTIKITLDGGSSSLNFAEAALLIQGTSAVYAKKVEYLYTLVFKVLEVITDKKKNGEEKKDGEEDDEVKFDVELNFLLLDDVIETGDKINLMEEDVDAIGDWEHNNVEFGRAGNNKRRMSTNSNRRLSHASAISKGSAALNASLVADIGSSGLRLMSSDVNASGALLLPGSNAFNDDDVGSDNGFDVDGEDDMSGGFDLDGDGFGMNDDVNKSSYSDPNTTGVSDSLALAIPHANDSYVSSNTSKLSAADPWRLVDPHRNPDGRNRPLKKGKTFTIPVGIMEDGSLDNSQVNETSLNASTSINKSSFVVKDENLKLKGLAYGQEFAYVAKEIKKRKATKKRRSKKANNWYGKKKKKYVEDLEEEEEEEQQDYDDGFGAGDDDEGGFSAFEGAGPQNVDDERFNKMFGGAAAVGDDGEDDDEKYYNRNPMEETRFEEKFESLCKAHLRAFAAGAERYAAESQLTKRVADWSFKLQPTLQSEEKRTAFDIHETGTEILGGMQAAVSKQKAEGKKFKGSNASIVDFHAVTSGMEQYEVCRVFLASLMLANAGNITLSHPEMDGSGVADNINMELHGTNLDKPMDTYVAPSVMESENSQEAVGAV
ncbi:hypothetical protein TrST_g6089 [Triparma strigata]|uniref:Condensin-2 complex subunit H2 n=1 Tax=Triparma strigata TaxID=1606541 RepID=A0A9W7EXR4_9STRA|nr:hypothetical protein TrST_g6089 [Triparma strigata]